jgi:probable rRNA maturation factor
MINLQVKRTIKLPVDRSTLLHAAQVTLDFVNASGSDVSIVLGNDELLKKLNLKYRNVDAATDVLSFPFGELDPDTGSIYLGDVAISLPHAKAQAEAGDHPLADELQLLVVHGILHLLGYDHLEQVEKEKMQFAQDSVLYQLGVRLVSTL